jgi:hypothetical protein
MSRLVMSIKEPRIQGRLCPQPKLNHENTKNENTKQNHEYLDGISCCLSCFRISCFRDSILVARIPRGTRGFLDDNNEVSSRLLRARLFRFFVSGPTGRHKKRSAQHAATEAAPDSARHVAAAGDLFPREDFFLRSGIVPIDISGKLVGIHRFSSLRYRLA